MEKLHKLLKSLPPEIVYLLGINEGKRRVRFAIRGWPL